MLTFEQKVELVKIASQIKQAEEGGSYLPYAAGAGAVGAAGVGGKYVHDEYKTQKALADAISGYGAKSKKLTDRLLTTGSERAEFDMLNSIMQQAELEKGQRGGVLGKAMSNLGEDVVALPAAIKEKLMAAPGAAKDLGLQGKAKMLELAKKIPGLSKLV